MTEANPVAAHYNAIPEGSQKQRARSTIFKLRSFNNWIKCVLIDVAVERLLKTRERRSQLRVVDLACGKGGDVGKWHQADVAHVSFVDVADVSLSQARDRFHEARDKLARHGHSQSCRNDLYTADFQVADMRADELLGGCATYDLVACQFALHYAFGQEAHAHHMMRSISKVLSKGGLLIGTTLNADRIVALLRANKGQWQNDECIVETKDTRLSDPSLTPPLFGAEYVFSLSDQVVKCAEWLVEGSLLAAVGRAHGLQLILKQSFANFFAERIKDTKYRQLADTMRTLHVYNANRTTPEEEESAEFEAARKAHRVHGVEIGTLKLTEAQIADLYIVFMFVKL